MEPQEPIRAVVVDDEQLAREELCFLLGQIGAIEVVAQASNGLEALRMIEEEAPDLVMLDVQMPGLTGFEVARRLLRGGGDAQIVFVTAYDQYAIEAFEVNAVDYLLKPVEPSRLETTVDRVRRRIHSERPGARPAAELDKVLHLLGDRQDLREQLALKVGDRFLLIQADEVVHASVEDDVITVETNSLSGTSNYRTLDELQAHLDPDGLLARASVAPGEHQQDQGDRALVQPQFPVENARRQRERNPCEPVTDQAAPRVFEALTL